MPTRLLFLTLLLLLTLANSAWGRLGETEGAVITRYGKPHFKTHRPWGDDEGFTMNGFNITVTFINGISQGELFGLPGKVISEEQAKSLLTANSEGYLWDEVPKSELVPPAKQMWKKPNGSTAVLTGSYFEFKSAALIAAMEEVSKQKPDAPSTQGF